MPTLKIIPSNLWFEDVAFFLQERVSQVLECRGSCTIFLTGGDTAANVYNAWAKLRSFQNMSGASFYFGDERCLPSNHPESNFALSMRTLFKYGIPRGCNLNRIQTFGLTVEQQISAYEAIIPAAVDILLLGLADDGHIASLFPGGSALEMLDHKITLVKSPNHKYERLTITPAVIKNASSIYLFAFGAKKAKILSSFLDNSLEVDLSPIKLLKSATWLLSENPEK